MDQEKEYVCGYTYCKHKGIKVPSDEAIKDGTRYYHCDCHKEKEEKKKILDLYYKAYKSTESYGMVQKVLAQLIYEEFYPSEYVLFVLCQAIRQKIPFKSFFTLGWLVKNEMQIRKKYEQYKAKEVIKDFSFNDIETVKPKDVNYNKNNGGSWEDTLFG